MLTGAASAAESRFKSGCVHYVHSAGDVPFASDDHETHRAGSPSQAVLKPLRLASCEPQKRTHCFAVAAPLE
jgi:hypothetical protein